MSSSNRDSSQSATSDSSMSDKQQAVLTELHMGYLLVKVKGLTTDLQLVNINHIWQQKVINKVPSSVM